MTPRLEQIADACPATSVLAGAMKKDKGCLVRRRHG
jgi:hypothetical protein